LETVSFTGSFFFLSPQCAIGQWLITQSGNCW
jgi:hypothetical protein